MPFSEIKSDQMDLFLAKYCYFFVFQLVQDLLVWLGLLEISFID